MISEDKKNEILAVSQIYDVVCDFQQVLKQGASYSTECPHCGKSGKGKGLIITPAKNIAKCFSCDQSQTPAGYLMDYQNMSYPEALEWLAKKYVINIKETKQQQPSKRKQKSFRDKQLEESGLTLDEVKATEVKDDKKKVQIDPFFSGTFNKYMQVDLTGDDMIIRYLDLEGKPVIYKTEKGKEKEFLRVRWQVPDNHENKDGTAGKYKSPYGSGSPLYIPEKVRRAYQLGRQIKTLYFDEGEKKSEKSCMHGMFSLGLQGIQNLAYKGQIPHEIQLIIKTCQVEQIVFRMDTDWQDLSYKIKTGDKVDGRAWSFFHAVKNFRDYIKNLANNEIYVECYLATLLKNEANEKGVDDILAGSFKDKEKELAEDHRKALIEKSGKGKYVQFYKISTWTDTKLIQLWNLQDPEKFAEFHKETLQQLQEFKIKNTLYRFNESGEFEMAQPLEPSEQYWEITYSKAGTRIQFKYTRCWRFLQNRGFGRIRMANGKFEFVHIDKNIVQIVDSYYIKDFVTEITESAADEEVLDMIYRGGPQLLGQEKLSNLKYVFPKFERATKESQNLFFKDKFWNITKDGIVEKPMSALENHIWKDQVNDVKVEKLKEPLLTITPMDEFLKDLPEETVKEYSECKGKYYVELTKLGKECQYLDFLAKTSDFSWNDTDPSEIDKMENMQHLLSKLYATGYLLHTYFIRSQAKAVIGMDGKLSEIGESNGGTGKSIHGFAIGKVIPQYYVDGTRPNITEDRFIWDGLTEKENSIFVDDVRTNFDFKIFFNAIEGRWEVQNKGLSRFRIPEEETGKIYLTTNNAINGDGDSYERRQMFIAFSDYFNKDRTPNDEYGGDLFNDWDLRQWNMFYNLMGLCLQIYFKYDLKEMKAPSKRLRMRRLRQTMGEGFITWAEKYFAKKSDGLDNKINERIPRLEMFADLKSDSDSDRRYCTSNKFKKKILAYCEYTGLELNPKQKGGYDKHDGIEYFTIADKDFVS